MNRKEAKRDALRMAYTALDDFIMPFNVDPKVRREFEEVRLRMFDRLQEARLAAVKP